MDEDQRLIQELPERPFETCDRLCIYRGSVEDTHIHGIGCAYALITGMGRVPQVYKLLGVSELTDEARELLRPVNCPFFVEGSRLMQRMLAGYISREEENDD